MTTCFNIIEVLRRLNPELPVFVETEENHIQGSIQFKYGNYYDSCIGYLFTDLSRKRQNFIVETDETCELFSEEDWKDNNYSSKTGYIKDWLLDKFPRLNNIIVNPYSRDMIPGYFGEIILDKINQVSDIFPDIFSEEVYREKTLGKYIILLPYTDFGGVHFHTTLFNGIGINKREFTYSGQTIKRGEALIINTSLGYRRGTEICDFSLYRPYALNPRPKKPSQDLFHCLISERRKTYEK